MRLEEVMNLYQGTSEEAPVAKGIKNSDAANVEAFDCDCHGDWRER